MRLLLPAVALLASVAGRGFAGDAAIDPGDAPRGPSEIRDEQLLAQPRLTLPAVTPNVTPKGAWAGTLGLLWSSTFAWNQDVPGEQPKVRRYLLDGEALTVDATIRRGLTANLDLGLRAPMRWRGGGVMDELIDFWHRLLGLPSNHRPDFRRNAFRVEGTTTGGQAFSWNDRAGFGLGDAELGARWRFHDGARREPSLALVARLSLPTGSAPFDGNGLGAGGQLVMAAPFGGRLDAYAGFGATTQRGRVVDGIAYEPKRAHGFFALEWRPWRRLSVLAETNAASRLVTNIESYPGLHWTLDAYGRLDVGQRTRLDLGVTEGLASQDATTDFAIWFAVSLRP